MCMYMKMHFTLGNAAYKNKCGFPCSLSSTSTYRHTDTQLGAKSGQNADRLVSVANILFNLLCIEIVLSPFLHFLKGVLVSLQIT